jgi:DNA uptake protein ComE-like DNA-binding protein
MFASEHPFAAGPGSNRLDPCLTMMILLWVVALAATGPRLHRSVPLTSATVRSGVNPNTAPWWELTILPGIGPTRAREIVQYRESQQSLAQNTEDATKPLFFRRPSDLDAVHGIGPKTVERIAKELRFEPL